VGVLIDFMVNIDQLAQVSARWPWTTSTLVGMAICGAVLLWLAKGTPKSPVGAGLLPVQAGTLEE
jgi:hypothetical protein